MRRIIFLIVTLILVLAACSAPDGPKIAFVTYGQLSNDYSMFVHDSSGTSVLVPDGSDPSLFPDGSFAYSAPGYEEYDQGNRDLWRMTSNGNSVNLTNTRMVDEIWPTVSPDGSLIAYLNGSNNGDLCFMKADGTDGWCLSTKSYVYTINCSLYGEQPTASCADLDGLHINPFDFRWNPLPEEDQNELVVGSNWNGEGNKVYRFILVDGLLVHINLIVDNAVRATLSPDGRLAFYDYQSGNTSTINLDGSDPQVLVNQEAQEISWSPDGKKIALSIFDEDNSHAIYLMSPDGSGLEKIIDGYSPVWSPDGTKMLFLRQYPNDENMVISSHNKLFLHDFKTNTEVLIHDNDPFSIVTSAMFIP